LYIPLEDSREGGVERLLKLIGVRGSSVPVAVNKNSSNYLVRQSSNVPDKCTQSFEMEVIESRVAWVAADDLCDIDQMLQNIIGDGDDTLLDHNQDSHGTPHDELIFLNFLRSWVLLNQ
jgi:hypothetical protein